MSYLKGSQTEQTRSHMLLSLLGTLWSLFILINIYWAGFTGTIDNLLDLVWQSYTLPSIDSILILFLMWGFFSFFPIVYVYRHLLSQSRLFRSLVCAIAYVQLTYGLVVIMYSLVFEGPVGWLALLGFVILGVGCGYFATNKLSKKTSYISFVLSCLFLMIVIRDVVPEAYCDYTYKEIAVNNPNRYKLINYCEKNFIRQSYIQLFY